MHPVPAINLAARVVLSVLACSAFVGTMQGQDAAPPAASTAEPLFTSDAPLTFRVAGDLKTLLDDRDSTTSTYHPFTLTYQEGDGAPVSLEVEFKTRGHWRRQERHCDFPPLRLNVPKSKVEGTLFAGQDKLKLVTPCQPRDRDYREYILREYAVYKALNQLTALSHRVRLATTTYVDTTRRGDSLTVQTFLIEDEERMATRNGGQYLEAPGAQFADMDSVQMGVVGVFLYMIGATDWSLRSLHNMEIVLDQQRNTFQPITYDFDFTGIVNTAYARPDPRLRIPNNRYRLYRGGCFAPEHWDAVVARFQDQKAAIYQVYDSLPGLSERYVRETKRYLDDFYKILDDPDKFTKEIVKKCWTQEGI